MSLLPEPSGMSGCLTCPNTRCCQTFEPSLTLADLKRLTSFGLSVREVARLKPGLPDELGPMGISLGQHARFELVLATSREERGKACFFYLALDGARGRCGIYSQRPMQCRLFPSAATPLGVFVQTPETICPPHAFEQARADLAVLGVLHRQHAREQLQWQDLLAQWNLQPQDEAAFWRWLSQQLEACPPSP